MSKELGQWHFWWEQGQGEDGPNESAENVEGPSAGAAGNEVGASEAATAPQVPPVPASVPAATVHFTVPGPEGNGETVTDSAPGRTSSSAALAPAHLTVCTFPPESHTAPPGSGNLVYVPTVDRKIKELERVKI